MKSPPGLGLTALITLLSVPFPCPAQSGPTNIWALKLPDYYTTSSPAIAPDGTIYLA